ncbi:outer membrane beta-barrel protein [Helicobacter sp. T3_23-1056]
MTNQRKIYCIDFFAFRINVKRFWLECVGIFMIFVSCAMPVGATNLKEGNLADTTNAKEAEQKAIIKTEANKKEAKKDGKIQNVDFGSLSYDLPQDDLSKKADTNDTKSKIQTESCNELCEYIKEQIATTKRKNGYFVAVSGGANVLEAYNRLEWIPTFGVSFGVHSFFTPYIGVRGYVSADVGFGRYEGVLGMVSLGLDALAEFSLNRKKTAFLGGLLGFGVDGYVYYDKRDFSSLKTMQKSGGFYMEMGVSLSFLRHNRLNIIGRFIPARSVQDFSSAVLAFGQYSYTF